MALIFPLDTRKVKWESEVSSSWEVVEDSSVSGKRWAITYQTLPAREFFIEFPGLTGKEKDELFTFYNRCKGPLLPFFYKDAENYQCQDIRLPRNKDGSYQLVADMHGEREPIYYADQLSVLLDGEPQEGQYTQDRGAIVFHTPVEENATVTATYEYYWKVCFAESKITIKQRFKDLFTVSLRLKVVR